MTATLKVVGRSGASIVNPEPMPHGADGAPLGKDGNGKNGVEQWFQCKSPAEIGQPGNHGDTGPSGENGGNGLSAYAVRLLVDEFIGGPITLLNHGGDGGNGGDGGRGGNGSDGGNAGKQPRVCRGVVYGGPGGNSGQGGLAGSGGAAGSAGDVKILLGPELTEPPVNVESKGGSGGKQGNPGPGGTPGKGGRNSDGSYANDGVDQGSGDVGTSPGSGYGGSLDLSTDPTAAPRSLHISILPRGHG